MTEEQNEKLHELYEKYYVKCIPLTYDEKTQLMELENIKRHDRRNKQDQLRKSACDKLKSNLGLDYDEITALIEMITTIF